MGEVRRKYDSEFREGAVTIVRQTGRPIVEVAHESASGLARWVTGCTRTGTVRLRRDSDPPGRPFSVVVCGGSTASSGGCGGVRRQVGVRPPVGAPTDGSSAQPGTDQHDEDAEDRDQQVEDESEGDERQPEGEMIGQYDGVGRWMVRRRRCSSASDSSAVATWRRSWTSPSPTSWYLRWKNSSRVHLGRCVEVVLRAAGWWSSTPGSGRPTGRAEPQARSVASSRCSRGTRRIPMASLLNRRTTPGSRTRG